MLKMYENDVEVTCTGDCEHYAKEPAIVMNVVNCDGISKMYAYPTLDDLKTEWYAEEEDEPIIPMLDDRLVCGEVDGEEVHGETVKAVFDVLKEKYGWDY